MTSTWTASKNREISQCKNVLILGYGKEGRTTHKYLKKYFPKLKIGIGDAKRDAQYLEKQGNYDLAVKTPGMPKELVTIPYTTATNIFFSQIKNTIVGITGSKGKSTTASLIYAILKKAGRKARLFGNIGEPMLGALLAPVEKSEIFVIELSSYQLEDIKYSPHIAVATALFPAHMHHHGGARKYYQAKKNVINFQQENDIFVYNSKDRKLKKWAEGAKSATIPADCQGIDLADKEIRLLGRHNEDNMKIAVTIAKLFNIPDEIIMKALRNFKGLPHRLEFIGEFRGIKFYDDAISTLPESTVVAIKALPKIGTIFLGGHDEGYNFNELEKTVRRYQIKNVVLFPESGRRMFKTKRGLNILEAKSMEKAVKFAYQNTKQGEICLLSTACPSYTLWESFEVKADEFKKFVRTLK